VYNIHTNGLGEDPAPAEPSMWDNILKLGTNVVTQGFNIYNRVQNLTQQQKQTQAAQAQATMMRQYYGGMPLVPGQPGYGQPLQPAYGQPGYGQSDFFSGWTIPLLLAGAAVVGVVILRKK